ncbi:MAG: SDR family oxidoreductase [Lentisphaerae bacterium]|nr:SDR family oxidoreductase [Lentisphaerota bacterium]
MPALESKTIAITGGSLGIGLAVAKKCAAEGATVILAARDKIALQSALRDVKSVSPAPHAVFPMDVSREEDVRQFAAFCAGREGAIHGLVNCAGIYGPIGKTHEVNMTDFARTHAINFLGTVFMCQAFIPLLAGKPRKKIVIFAGGGAATPFPFYSAYATSKVALVRLTENLARELDVESFDVNCVAPGFVITRLHEETMKAGPEAASPQFYEATKKQMAGGGVPPERAADLTAFLLSAASDGITGKFISAQYDPWETDEFQDQLRQDKNLATLRRIDNKFFAAK